MEVSISNELYVFIWSVASGVIISVLFDMFRVMRKKVPAGSLISFIQDLMFWIMATVLMFFMVFYTNNGELRWFQFFGAVLGSVLYFLLLSEITVNVISFVVEKIYNIFQFFFKILLTPIAFMYKILYICLSFIFRPLIKYIHILKNKFFYSMKICFKRCKYMFTKK